MNNSELREMINEMIQEGQYGPGTKVNAKIKDKNWKAEIGAIENKKRPEALYVTFSSWVKPKLSVVAAKANSTSEPEALAVSIIVEFMHNVDLMKRKIASAFDPDFFDTSSIIFTYDIAAGQAKPGKRQFIEFEINIDTVNDIDMNGEATVDRNGKMNEIPFKDFIKPAEQAIDKILQFDALNIKKSPVDFAKTKGGK